MQTAIITAYNQKFQNLANLTVPNKQEYAKRYGYTAIISDFHIPRITLQPKPKHRDDMNHYKLCWLKELCHQQKYDWVVWIDTDAIIMNMKIPLEEFIDNHYDFIIGEDWNGINAGVYFLKTSQQGLNFVNACINYEPTEYDRTKTPWWWWPSEQAAFARCMHLCKTKVVHHSLFNGYFVTPNPGNTWFHKNRATFKVRPFQLGDFILHTVSTPSGTRLKILQKMVTQVIR